MFHALFATPIVILRPSFAYGPGQEATKLVPHVITTLLAGGSPALSSGDRLLDLVFARDVAEAYLAAAVASDVEGSTIDIGVGHLTSVRDVVATIVGLVGTTRGCARVRPRRRPTARAADRGRSRDCGGGARLARANPPGRGAATDDYLVPGEPSQAAPDVTTR